MTKQMQDRIDDEAEKNTDRSNQADNYWNYVVKKDRKLGFIDGATFMHYLMLADMKEMAEALEAIELESHVHSDQYIIANEALAKFHAKYGEGV